MKFFSILRPDPDSTASDGPSQEFVALMGEYFATRMASNKVLATGAMEPIQKATIVEPVAGRASVVDGPFTEAKELVGGWVLIEAESRDEAVQGSKDFVQFHIDNWPGWNGFSEVHEVYG
jgi:hypothetical protein